MYRVLILMIMIEVKKDMHWTIKSYRPGTMVITLQDLLKLHCREWLGSALDPYK